MSMEGFGLERGVILLELFLGDTTPEVVKGVIMGFIMETFLLVCSMISSSLWSTHSYSSHTVGSII